MHLLRFAHIATNAATAAATRPPPPPPHAPSPSFMPATRRCVHKVYFIIVTFLKSMLKSKSDQRQGEHITAVVVYEVVATADFTAGASASTTSDIIIVDASPRTSTDATDADTAAPAPEETACALARPLSSATISLLTQFVKDSSLFYSEPAREHRRAVSAPAALQGCAASREKPVACNYKGCTATFLAVLEAREQQVKEKAREEANVAAIPADAAARRARRGSSWCCGSGGSSSGVSAMATAFLTAASAGAAEQVAAAHKCSTSRAAEGFAAFRQAAAQAPGEAAAAALAAARGGG
jgi:trimeric autotransporter adhesin